MSRLFFNYYLDTTKFNLIFCLIFYILRPNLVEISVLFGTVGTFISFVIYKYYNNIEYYFYLNKGISRLSLKRNTFLINIVISVMIIATLWVRVSAAMTI